MQCRSLSTLQEHPLPRYFAISAGIVLIALFVSAAKAEDTVEDVLQKAGCTVLKTNGSSNLSASVHLQTLNNAALGALEANLQIAKLRISQVKVRTNDGHQYFLVLPETVSYQCGPTVNLPVQTLYNPVESQSDVMLKLNPCCTSTSGGDAQAQWFNLTYCPMMKPVKRLDAVCGR